MFEARYSVTPRLPIVDMLQPTAVCGRRVLEEPHDNSDTDSSDTDSSDDGFFARQEYPSYTVQVQLYHADGRLCASHLYQTTKECFPERKPRSLYIGSVYELVLPPEWIPDKQDEYYLHCLVWRSLMAEGIKSELMSWELMHSLIEDFDRIKPHEWRADDQLFVIRLIL